MNSCSDYLLIIPSYLENALRGDELKEFLAHIETCGSCRSALEDERALSLLLHRSRPLYSAPSTLHDRIAATIRQHSASLQVQERFDAPAVRPVRSGFLFSPQKIPRPAVWVWASLLVAFSLIFAPSIVRQARAASYVRTAINTHRNYLDGTFSPQFQSSSPELVTQWFRDKVPFDFRLPSAGAIPNEKIAYRLTGAGLVNFQGTSTALVTYEQHQEKISLLVAPSTSAVVAGGDEVRFGSLTFHYRSKQDFNVITWSNHGLSYALVSSVTGSAQESCLVCHQSMAGVDNFKPLANFDEITRSRSNFGTTVPLHSIQHTRP